MKAFKVSTRLTEAFDRWSILILVLVGCVVSFGLTMTCSAYLQSLGSNLLAGFIGSGVTLFGFDRLQTRRKAREQLPARYALYEHIRMIVRWSLELWKRIYMASVGDAAPQSWEELFSEANFGKMRGMLDLNQPVGVFEEVLWRDHVSEELNKIYAESEKALVHHQVLLGPEVQKWLRKLAGYNFGESVSLSESVLGHMKVKPPPLLVFYVAMPPQWFDAVLGLHQWTVLEHERLKNMGVSDLHPPYFFEPLDLSKQRSARFDPAMLVNYPGYEGIYAPKTTDQ
ncbi:hypothetical protein [Paraburkholderia oxyphila]|uniref:hypothetical protein n=1 Tax=Paraburkholderia oxyphila TaxID=614212 RepID=UPI00047FAC99|nr:hypothetical protein [Paraburkholderia oxyphila]